jgi:hypothetical protein
MTDIDDMIDTLAAMLPAGMCLDCEATVAVYLVVTVGDVHGYRRALIGEHLPAIVQRAQALRNARAA